MGKQIFQVAEPDCFKTKLALLWMNLSSEPLLAIYGSIPFILRRELGASTYQIALLAIISPVLSVFSYYWAAWLTMRKAKLLTNLVGAWILARTPFLFFPWLDNFTSVFIACAIYQLFSRASTPALMEILKRNISKNKREHAFSLYYGLSVLEGILIGFLLTQVLEISGHNWKIIFLSFSLISLTSVLFQLFVKVPQTDETEISKKNFVLQPLKKTFDLLRSRPDFARFQWGYMIGGFALMLIAPARSIFAADSLPISIADTTLARCVFVGIGMAGSSLVWKKALELYGIQRLTTWILIGFGLFPCALLLSLTHTAWFFLAHLIYGVTQGGSHLVWHLSGTIFAGDQNSVPFTTTNVLMIGLRGALAPLLGGFLCEWWGASPVLFLGALIALSGGWFMRAAVSKRPVNITVD